MKNILFVITLSLCCLVGLLAQATSFYGCVKMEGKGANLSTSTIILYQKGELINETETDSVGYYKFENLKPGTYTIEVDCSICEMKRFENVQVFAGKAIKLNVELLSESIWMDEITIIAYKVPEIITPNIGCSIVAYTIRKLPTLKMSVFLNPVTSQRSVHSLFAEKPAGCSGGNFKKKNPTIYSLTASQVRLLRMKKIVKNLNN